MSLVISAQIFLCSTSEVLRVRSKCPGTTLRLWLHAKLRCNCSASRHTCASFNLVSTVKNSNEGVVVWASHPGTSLPGTLGMYWTVCGCQVYTAAVTRAS